MKREPNSGSFRKGQGGRPKGARNKFSKAVVEAFAANWAVNGEQAIENLRIDKLDAYVKHAVSFVPKDLDIKQTSDLNVTIVQFKDMYDDDGDEQTD